MARPTALVLTVLVLLGPGAALRAGTAAATGPATAALGRLQGTWEGVSVGAESAGKVTITFSGNALHFQGLTAPQWYDATFTLKEGTSPRQLHATITGSAGPGIGTAVGAIFKIENGTLSLAGLKAGASDDAQAFEGNTIFHYRLRRVEPPAKKAGRPSA